MLETEARTSAASERAQLIEALIEVAAERGYMDTSIEMVIARAGLDRPAFDRHFRGKYDGFLSAWQEMNEECMASLMRAYDSEQHWPDRLRAVACEVVGSLCNEPSRACFAVEVLAAGDAARARRDMTMRVIASLIDAGRKEMDDPESVPHTTAEALAGSAYGQVYAKVVRGDTDELPKLIPQLMSAAVMPYLGVEAALEELDRGSNPPDRYRRPVAADPADTPVEDGEEYPPELARLPPGTARPAARVRRPQPARAPDRRPRRGDRRKRLRGDNHRPHHPPRGGLPAHLLRALRQQGRVLRRRLRHGDGGAARARRPAPSRRRTTGRTRSRPGSAAMLRFLAAEPNLARLCMVEALVAGPVVVERYDSAIQSFVPYFQSGREGRSPEVLARLSPTTEEALVGGMMSLISRRIIAGKTDELESLLPDLVEFTLTPYLGSEEAAKVAREG